MRKSLPVLVFTALAVGAPVPKLAPTMTERFDEPTAAKEECVAEMGRDGTLKLTLPVTARIAAPTNVASIGPLVSKSVEGDFTLTARMTLDIPEGAKSKDRNNPAGLAAGLCAYVDGEKPGSERCTAVTVGRHNITKAQASFFEYHWSGTGGGSTAGNAQDIKAGSPAYLRVSRKSDEVSTAYSADGKKWHETGTYRLPGTIRVGPVAFGCVDKEFTATFDEYELKVQGK